MGGEEGLWGCGNRVAGCRDHLQNERLPSLRGGTTPDTGEEEACRWATPAACVNTMDRWQSKPGPGLWT